jgi:UDP-3-O-[3-hydroxymyristoyl] glucosamine N-acyltransferase
VDNLVQIAHGVTLGQDNLIVAQAAIAGSTTTGNHVVLGGQVGVVGHIKIADKVQVAAKAGVTKSLTEPGKYNGNPAIALSQHNRTAVLLRNIKQMADQLKIHEKKLNYPTKGPST